MFDAAAFRARDEDSMNFDILLPITLVVGIVYAIKVVVDARSRRQLVNGCDPTRELVGRGDANEVRQKRPAEQSIQRSWFSWQRANVARGGASLIDDEVGVRRGYARTSFACAFQSSAIHQRSRRRRNTVGNPISPWIGVLKNAASTCRLERLSALSKCQ